MRTVSLILTPILLAFLLCSCSTMTADSSVNSSEKMTNSALKYTGWVALKRQTLDPNAGEDDWIYTKDIKVDDKGAIVKILDEGKETGYSLQLIKITYEKTNKTVLKLGVIEDATEYTKAYAWAEPGAKLLGINVRWMQTGFTLDADQ